MESGAGGTWGAEPARWWAGCRWVFSTRAAPSSGWSAAPPRPLPPACAAGSGGAGARAGGGFGRGAAPRAGPGRRALAVRVAPRAPLSGRSPGLGPPILLRRGECDGRPPGLCWYPCLLKSRAGSERPCVCPSVCGWGHRWFSKAVPVSVHVRRVHVRDTSGGILRAVAAHVRSILEGGDAGGWVMMVPWKSAGVWELVYIGGGCPTLRPRVTLCEVGGWVAE